MSDDEVELDPDDLLQNSMEYLRSFQFISENPKWLQTVLFLGICQLIPIAGPIATLGYQFELAESLLLRKCPGGYADFDFNKFLDYLMRGLWPFLVALVVSVVLVIPMVFLWIAFMIGFAVIGHDARPGARDGIALLMMGGVFFLFLLLSFVMNIVMIPMSLRAGYSQDFGEAFDFGFIKDFVSRMWLESLLSILFLAICSFPLMIAGLLCCGIGIYVSLAVVMLAQAHLLDYQLYVIYLSRGGEPIPLKPAPVP